MNYELIVNHPGQEAVHLQTCLPEARKSPAKNLLDNSKARLRLWAVKSGGFLSEFRTASLWSMGITSQHFPLATDSHRLHPVMQKFTEGLLSTQEREELEGLVELSETLSLVRARALLLLNRKP
jgi:hypothetical protein